MRGLRAWLIRLADVVQRTRSDQEFSGEIQSHLDLPLPDARDRASAPLVVVVHRTFARINWPNESALGYRVTFGGPPLRTIVGVVKDVRERGYEPDMKPAAYIPYAQTGDTAFIPETLIVRAAGDLNLLVPGIRRAVARVDPEQPLAAIRTMEEVLELDVADRR